MNLETPKHTVALQDCQDYDQARVDAAISSACIAAGFPDVAGKSVLLKPNLLNASDPQRAATTHPSVLRAAIRFVKSRGAASVSVGDSPGWQAQDMVGGKTGIMEAAKAEGAAWVDFSEGASVEVPEARLIRRFEIAKAILAADIIITVPKLKTHGLMYYTGAVKNLFGAIPGFKKSAFHLRFPGREEFAMMIADLALAVKPAFAIMDAVTGMEGQGPNNGTPRHIGLILASRNSFALDWVGSSLIGYDPVDVPYLKIAADDERYGFNPKKINTVGEDPAARAIRHFELVRVLHENDFFRKFMPAWLHRAARNLTVAKPYFSDERCVRCSGCVQICPAGALAFVPDKQAPAVDYSACIRCYCCDEVCPEDAIRLRRTL